MILSAYTKCEDIWNEAANYPAPALINLFTSASSLTELLRNQQQLLLDTTQLIVFEYNISRRCVYIDIGDFEVFIGTLFETYSFILRQEQDCPFFQDVDCNVTYEYKLEYVEENPLDATYR